MIARLAKYGALILIVNTILFQCIYTMNIANYIFYSLMPVYLIFTFIYVFQYNSKYFNKEFLLLNIISLINILYFLLIDKKSEASFNFLAARFVQFSVLIFSVAFGYKYYAGKFFKHIAYIILIQIIIGLFLATDLFSRRYQGIVLNSNELGYQAVIAIAFLLLPKEKLKPLLDWIISFFLFFIVLVSGSRAAFIGAVLVYLFKYGLSVKSILVLIFGGAIIYLFSRYGLESGFSRISDTAGVSPFDDRKYQYIYAFLTFKENWLLGCGLEHYAYIDQDLVPSFIIAMQDYNHILGAHNGYLSFMVQYGIVFVSVIFGFFIFYLVKFVRYYSIYWMSITTDFKTHFFIFIYSLIVNVFENATNGINSLSSNIFWLSIIMLNIYIKNTFLAKVQTSIPERTVS